MRRLASYYRQWDRRYGKHFVWVFVPTYAATMFLYPLLVIRDVVGESGSGLFVVIAYGFSVFAGVTMLIESLLVAIPVFAAVSSAIDYVTPDWFGWLAFVVSCSVSAFASCYVAVHTEFSIDPVSVHWVAGRVRAVELGGIAASLCVFVASWVWVASRESVKDNKESKARGQ